MTVINLEESLMGFDRYNGGWIKTITGLDKDYTNGYSLNGEFVGGSNVKNVDLQENVLYLDCSISGSRKNQVKNYHLFKMVDGEIDIIQTIEDGQNDWAVQLWDKIEEELNIIPSKVEMLEKEINKLSDEDFCKLLDNLKTNSKRFRTLQTLFLAQFASEYRDNSEDYDEEINHLKKKGLI